jgi:hypothetical protein
MLRGRLPRTGSAFESRIEVWREALIAPELDPLRLAQRGD